MLAKQRLPACQVFFVTDDTSIFVGVKEPAQAFIVATITQDIESNSALALVIWLPNVFLVEEES